MPSRRRLLFVAHNHPRFHPGGAEIYAFELFQAFREFGRASPTLVTKAPANPEADPAPPFTSWNHDAAQLAWTPPPYDDFLHRSREGARFARQVLDLLERTRPEIVHLQHFTGLGLDLLPVLRRARPTVPIVLTLHEFLPICNARGLMARPDDEALCSRPSPIDCHRCFPRISAMQFYLRERTIKSHLELVDLFLAPSRNLKQTYVDWGIAEDRILFHDYGRPRIRKVDGEDPPPGRFGFFGQIMRHKGILVLLEAMEILERRGVRDVELLIHGANAHFDGPEFVAELRDRSQRSGGRVSNRGPYRTEDLPRLLRDCAWVVVPSLWWENSPLVIQEAFQLRRPVLCGHRGGSAEKVEHEVNGLHFQHGDPFDLALQMERATREPHLWSRLRSGIPEIRSLDEETATLSAIYESLIERRRDMAS